MPNRLPTSTSPYLLQHADNPVDWWEWGDEAFAEATRRDVPVLLSVGYSACHWCHVMAHESFEDEQVADALNRDFVSVKVDREERPDVDAVYMTATQALTGHGGWPMTCLLTPQGRPFFAGTYLPRERFLALLASARDAWSSRRADVEAGGEQVVALLQRLSAAPPAALDEDALGQAVAGLGRAFDPVHAGFGGAPKFPPSMTLEHLLRHHGRTGSTAALEMATRTCAAMARGGIYDQLEGGFARYAVDAAWVVPHFEKMLYDNAQLLRVYAHLWRATGDPTARRVVHETADFLLTRMLTGRGAFAAALDADTDGQEGLTYVWSPAELEQVLGREDGAWAAALLQVGPEGTFEHGCSTLRLPADPDDPERWAQVRERLRTARAARPQPARDDKVVASWNGMAIAALAEAGALLEEPSWVAAAGRCADHLLAVHLVDGRLRRTSRDGAVGAAPAVADDHGNLADGLLALHQATGEPDRLAQAVDLLEQAIARFGADDGGFHDTAEDAPALVCRPRGTTDGAEPCGQSALAQALVTAAALTGRGDLRERGEAAVRACGSVAGQDPRFAGWTLATAEALAAGPLEVAVVHAGDADGARALVQAARAGTSPGLVLAVGAGDEPGRPLLAGRRAGPDGPLAHVCRHGVCEAPLADPARLRERLAPPRRGRRDEGHPAL